MIFIISGNYQQSRDFSIKYGLRFKEWRYVRRKECLLGFKEIHFIKTGDFLNHEDYKNINDFLDLRIQQNRAFELSDNYIQFFN